MSHLLMRMCVFSEFGETPLSVELQPMAVEFMAVTVESQAMTVELFCHISIYV